jgi:hypothetical protein
VICLVVLACIDTKHVNDSSIPRTMHFVYGLWDTLPTPLRCLESSRLADFNATGSAESLFKRKTRFQSDVCIPKSIVQMRAVLKDEYALVKIQENSEHVKVQTGFFRHSLRLCESPI